MTGITEINIKSEIDVLFLALKLVYAVGLEDDYNAFRNIAKILRDYEYRR